MAERSQRPWLPIGLTLVAVVLVVFADWDRHDNVSVASLFSPHHPASVRVGIQLGTVAVLGALAVARPARISAVWIIAALLVAINTLATARVVMSPQAAPYTAVAGVELDRVGLRNNTGYYAAFLCFDRFSHDGRLGTTPRAAPETYLQRKLPAAVMNWPPAANHGLGDAYGSDRREVQGVAGRPPWPRAPGSLRLLPRCDGA